ncbi:uncharacterized protein LOC115218105 isoform X3 [Octopus sinensis]|uniref:Uncharacterized protein LOC115218105 isoform X3 n=1 Tax=Octopus sinensis TaxID=2607531 RepID=A0A7E6F9B7_9MOLL|nr:uncharacterized protein LOC115218105 isoform X3 [Octopus sinensis]
MLLNSCWCIFVFICLHFANIQATSWDVEVCYAGAYHSSVHIRLNNDYKDLLYNRKLRCFYGNFGLKSGEKPSFIKVDQGYGYKAHVENPDLPVKYVGNCSSGCRLKKVNLEKYIQATKWNVKVCYDVTYYYSVRITLNNDYKDVSYYSEQRCFYDNFELKSGEKPSFIKVNQNYGYKHIWRISVGFLL